ncbi:MAG TPA: MFS transporter [Dongiaceae bacterium]
MINPRARPCEELFVRAVGGRSSCTKRQQPWVLTAAVLASTMAFVDESVVNIALPAMEKDLAASIATMQWVVNAYTLGLAALLLTGGAAGDQFGRRKIFTLGLAIFAVTSLGCGLASNSLMLIACRGAQGLGAAFLIPSSLALIGAAFEESERGRAIGIWSGTTALAAGLAPLLGGWLVDHWSWRMIFLINPVLSLPAFWIVFRHIPESRDPMADRHLDWRGTLLAFGGLASFVYGLIAASDLGWGNGLVLGSLAVGVVLLAAFLWQERRSPAPMMPLGLFRSPNFCGVNLLTLLLYGALGGAFFFLPFAFIQLHGYSAAGAGAAFLPFTLILGVLSRWSGGLLDRLGPRLPLIAGPCVTALGLLLLALPGAGGAYWTTFFLPMLIIGFGMAVTVAPLTATVLNAVAARQTGTASGINNAVASVASLLAVAVLGTIAISTFDRSLDRHLDVMGASAEVRHSVDAMRGGFVATATPGPMSEAVAQAVHGVVNESLLETFRLVVLIAAGLAFAAALSAALTIRGSGAEPSPLEARPSPT